MNQEPSFVSLERWQAIHREITWGHHSRGEEAIRLSWEQTRNETQELWASRTVREGDVVLDIGSGNGRTGLGFQSYPIGQYIGLDAIKKSVRYCRRAFRKDKRFRFVWVDLKNDQYNPKGKIPADRLEVDIPPASVDVVLCMSLFSHLETAAVARRYVSEIHRVLKPGGRFFSSWFRSPPNSATEDPFRTVYPEETIREILDPFTLYRERGGTTTDFNDQWCLFARKDSL